MVDAVETMAWAGEKPWHGLGQEVPDNISTGDMLVKAGLNWTADLLPLTYELNGARHPAPQKAMVRSTDGKLLDVVGADWKPVQNAVALDFFRDFVTEGSMNMETAGSLSDGRHVFALAKVKGGFEVVKGDSVGSYLLFSNPHTYGKAPAIMLTHVRVVCWNTLTQALGDNTRSRFSWSHLRSFDTNHAEMAKEALGLASAQQKKMRDEMRALASTRMTPEDNEVYFKKVFDPKEVQEKKGKVSRNVPLAMKALEQQPGAELGEGTLWQSFNAVTFMTDHVLGKSQDARVNSALFGGYANLKQRAFDVALETAKAAS